jgi:DNA replication protein DnaC
MENLAQQLDGMATAFEKMATEAEFEDKDIYSCLICRDCGWIIEGGIARPCNCQTALKEEHKLLPIPHLQKMSFADFDLKLYPENIKTEKGKSYRQIAKDALTEAMNFTRSLARGINRPGLIFEGDVGSGKTFLAAAIANELIAKGIDVEFIVVPEFLDTLRQSMHSENNEDNALIIRAKKAAVLILDDMGAHNFSPWVQNMLFTIINFRLNHQLPIIITTNLDAMQLYDAVGERIASRLMETGTNVKLFIDKDIRLKLFKEGRNKW